MLRGKRGLAMLLVLAMLFTTAPTAFAGTIQNRRTWENSLFTDVSSGDWCYENVKNAYELELMSGYSDKSFKPSGEITLAQTVAVAARIHSIHSTGKAEFEQGDPWYRVYVDYALKTGIIDGELKEYNRAATRLEFAEILARALPESALKQINIVEDGAIPDVADNDAVYLLYRAGVIIGYDAMGTFLPNDTISRSEAAAISTRMATPSLRQQTTLTKAADGKGSNGSSAAEVGASSAENDSIEAKDLSAGILTQPFDLEYPDLFASGEINYSSEQILIKVSDEPTGKQQAALREAGVVGLEYLMDTDDALWYTASVSGEVISVMENVRKLAFILVAEYDFVYETETIIECESSELGTAVQGNSYLDQQWYLRACGIKDSWEYLRQPHKRPHYDEEGGSTGSDYVSGVEAGKNIVVAVIDTGVDYTHTDLAANIWVNQREIRDNGIDDDRNGYIDDYYGWNTVAENGNPMDDHGHGTHVAGIIAAANNNKGIVGIAYNAKVMCIKAGMASGYFNQSAIAKAISYAYENGADVINMSFGGSASSLVVQDALEKAYTRCVLVAAAGNDGAANEGIPSQPSYPAALSYVLGVMSVDSNGVESSFTNYDVRAFNSVEYEVYAPGDQMLSTIPGDRYATWSGTSMATPVVSAIAALVRSEYRDTNTYPTKFIYGQISATGETNATCCNPSTHGLHNLPAIVDVHNALTVLPTPDVNVMDYTVFDTVGLNGSTVNNGDGVIDAGETIAVGFTLRNKWGKSKNTIITVDAKSPAGISDPYITIHNDSVSVGQVGTYSTQDCGKIMEDNAFVGWQNPVYITVSKDCPNDYLINLNVTVTCENALNAADTAVYASAPSTCTIGVRRGTIVPTRIKADMTLSADQLYIIPDDTLIMAGVTVTVEEGTQIQFWSSDPQDPYAETAVAGLTVEGTLICNGTAENPVKMYPSELMDKYEVKIEEKNGGLVQLNHTHVVNPYVVITAATNCEFTQNYRNEPIWRRGPGGYEAYRFMEISIANATRCAFVKLGCQPYTAEINYSSPVGNCGVYDSCIFVDCAANLVWGAPMKHLNCVFYGNNNYLGEPSGTNTSLTLWDPTWELYEQDGYNSFFRNNAIINRLNDENVENWLRIAAGERDDHTPVPIDGNYWGTTNPELIERQIFDFDDYSTRGDLEATPYLTEAPEDVWPFVVKAGILDASGTETVVVGNEELTFYVEFNRDMDTDIPLDVCFGSTYPYADYQVDGDWVSDRRWEGTTTLSTLIEGGYQLWSISNGMAADEPLKLYEDWGRFPFQIDTSEALAMTLQGYATAEGIQLTWTQDDFDTLMGYNVYRADRDEDAYYQRLNSSIIPVGTEEFFDSTVEPGKDYYYIFTVVKTDLSESEPSGKRQIRSLDTMAPVMYHTPVYEAYVNNNVIIHATVTDNLEVRSVKLYYRIAGGAWQTVEMQQLNDKYSGLISGNNVTLEGVQYYISATDGVSTVYRGTKDQPYIITVKEPPMSLMIGDVNGDGVIGIADALLVLRAKNNKVVLTSEQFYRSDLDGDGILSAAEALKILRYANGEINSLQ